MTITLRGVPESLNHYMGRKNSKAYQHDKQIWTTAVVVSCFTCKDRPKKPYEKANVTITYYFPDRKRRDPDNYCGKMLIDGLHKAKVIKDDNFDCITLTLNCGGVDKANPRTVITVTEEET